eukprot:1157609-Pelagomonas_calceolata.AAC.5
MASKASPWGSHKKGKQRDRLKAVLRKFRRVLKPWPKEAGSNRRVIQADERQMGVMAVILADGSDGSGPGRCQADGRVIQADMSDPGEQTPHCTGQPSALEVHEAANYGFRFPCNGQGRGDTCQAAHVSAPVGLGYSRNSAAVGGTSTSRRSTCLSQFESEACSTDVRQLCQAASLSSAPRTPGKPSLQHSPHWGSATPGAAQLQHSIPLQHSLHQHAPTTPVPPSHCESQQKLCHHHQQQQQQNPSTPCHPQGMQQHKGLKPKHQLMPLVVDYGEATSPYRPLHPRHHTNSKLQGSPWRQASKQEQEALQGKSSVHQSTSSAHRGQAQHYDAAAAAVNAAWADPEDQPQTKAAGCAERCSTLEGHAQEKPLASSVPDPAPRQNAAMVGTGGRRRGSLQQAEKDKKKEKKKKKARPFDWWNNSSKPDPLLHHEDLCNHPPIHQGPAMTCCTPLVAHALCKVAQLPDFTPYSNGGGLRVQPREHVPDSHDSTVRRRSQNAALYANNLAFQMGGSTDLLPDMQCDFEWVQRAVRPLGRTEPLKGQKLPCICLLVAPAAAAVSKTSRAPPREWWRVPRGKGAASMRQPSAPASSAHHFVEHLHQRFEPLPPFLAGHGR